MSVFGVPTYFHANRLFLGFTNRKRKYFEEKMMATLKSKRTSIATSRPSSDTSQLPNPPHFSSVTALRFLISVFLHGFVSSKPLIIPLGPFHAAIFTAQGSAPV
jgi:hypothetical protein